MPGYLRQSTAAQSRALGPFIDDTDFKTTKTALTIANTDIKLVINGAASANKNSGGGTHRVNGVYGVTFDATDTATVGEMEVSVAIAGALVVFDKFFVVEEAVYDQLFVAAAPGASTVTALSTVQADTQDIQARLPAALTANGNIKADTLRVSGTVQTAGDLSAQIDAVDNFIDTEVAAILAAVDTEVAAIKTTTDKFVFTAANQVDAQVLSMAANTLTASALAADAATEIAAAVLAGVVETEGAYTLQQVASIVLAALAGRSDGAGTYLTPNNVATRIAGTVVAGARTAITLTPSA